MLITGADIGQFRALPHQRHPAVDRHRLMPSIQHGNARPRSAHHRGKHEQRMRKAAHRRPVRIEIARVISVHEAVATGLQLREHARPGLELERPGAGATNDRTGKTNLTKLLHGPAHMI